MFVPLVQVMYICILLVCLPVLLYLVLLTRLDRLYHVTSHDVVGAGEPYSVYSRAVMYIITSKRRLLEVLLGVVLSQPISKPLFLIDILQMYSYVVADVQENL